jgi:hypothetical protein
VRVEVLSVMVSGQAAGVAKLMPRHPRPKLQAVGGIHVEDSWRLPVRDKMLGINYESSDEEETISATKSNVSCRDVFEGLLIATNIELTNTLAQAAPAPEPLSEPAPLEQPAASTGPVNGPSQGPTASPPPPDGTSSEDAPPSSAYTSNRAMIQNLTLPTVPNFDIPPSPPGSPPQRATNKFAQFLELKKKGQHFNQRLEGSSVLRDPGHLRKLLDFAGVSEEDQYTSALSDKVVIPVVFPEWAYAEELKASQKRMFKMREQLKSKAPREAIDFVHANKSGTSSTAGTPSGMAGKRKELEHRSRDSSQPRNRSRSPKRRRSGSRDRR